MESLQSWACGEQKESLITLKDTKEMDKEYRKLKAREYWIEEYKKTGSVSIAARRCGIPRSTLYRWLKRYSKNGKDGLKDLSRRPHHLTRLKATDDIENLVLSIRAENRFGPQAIATHLLRKHNIKISSTTVWRILKKNNVEPVKKYRYRKVKRYSKKKQATGPKWMSQKFVKIVISLPQLMIVQGIEYFVCTKTRQQKMLFTF